MKKIVSKRPSLKKLGRVGTRKSLAQVAALPFRIDPEGRPEVLLITSRDTRRWVLPKGWPMLGRKAYRAAEREAFEEAGLRGEIARHEIGTYRYDKRLSVDLAVPCTVRVFPLRVGVQRKRWPEKGQREQRWFAPADAAALVQEDELRRLLVEFDPDHIPLS